jgi:hypothetical protein
MFAYLQHLFIDGFGYLTILFTFLFLLGIVGEKPLYFQSMSFFMLVYVGSFLVYRFKIQKVSKLTTLDQKVCYLGGAYILWFSLANIVTEYYNADFKPYVDDFIRIFKKD